MTAADGAARAEMISNSQAETERLGRLVGEKLGPGGVVALSGDLGAGKTYLVKGLARGLGIARPEEVVSPSFTLLNVHAGRLKLYHFDLYRLNDYNDFVEIGGEDYLEEPGVVAIEWAEKILSRLPQDYLLIKINLLEENKRSISLEAAGDYHREILRQLLLSGLQEKLFAREEADFEGLVH